MLTGVFLALGLTAAPIADDAPHCVPLGHAELMQRLATAGTVRLVFFSTWCSSCQKHLHPPYDMPTWFVGAFDSRERVEEALARLHVRQPCFMATDDLLKGLKIRRVPALWVSRDGTLEKG